mmetsp:Transcript_109868/g.342455  ORF Transcript_109868/g.342455 Transcript_109868/m.342455 type:complete len:317 (-) Transcript_109868:191-1141(-)
MVVGVRELVAPRLLVPGAVVPAHLPVDGLPADPAPVGLALPARHVVAAPVLLRLEGAARARLRPEDGCILASLPHQPGLVLLARALLFVGPGVEVAKVSTTSLAMHLRHGQALLGELWRHELLAARASSKRRVGLLLAEADVLIDEVRLAGEHFLQLRVLRLGHRPLATLPAAAKRQADGTDELLHATVLDAAPEVDLRARQTESMLLKATGLQDNALLHVGVLEAHRAEERRHRLFVPREKPHVFATAVLGVALAKAAGDRDVARAASGEEVQGSRGAPPHGRRGLVGVPEGLRPVAAERGRRRRHLVRRHLCWQ